jgi:hypothetical protein
LSGDFINMRLETVTKYFFDREEVQRRMTAKMVRVFSRFGAYVRTRDRSSIRYRKGPSEPGSPPSAHRTVARLKTNKKTGEQKMQNVSPLREFIFFAADMKGDGPGVVIGPTLLNGSRPGVLRIIEQGGEEVLPDAKGRAIRRMYKARPHTRPAFETEMQKSLPGMLGTGEKL